MGGFWYTLLNKTASLFGGWLFAFVSRLIALGYYFFSKKVRESNRFYRILYPNRHPLYHRWCSFKQYQNFTTIHLDRFVNRQTDSSCFTADGWEQLEARIAQRQGAILLMSHLGNWEMAATLLKQQSCNLKLLLYMGEKQKEGVERLQKNQLRDSGVRIIGVKKGESSAFSAVEGIHFLQEGGVVSMTGDIIWRDDQRQVQVDFLDHVAYLSEAPFIFSHVSKVPVYVFFAFRTGTNTYHLTLSPPIYVDSAERKNRQRAIQQAAEQYAFFLEQAVKAHPFEWYHFDRFVHDASCKEVLVE